LNQFLTWDGKGFLTKYYSGAYMKEEDMGGACGREDRRIQGFDGETRGKEMTWKA
jgi:hypothetical protein